MISPESRKLLRNRGQGKGFTLLEVMVTVLIISLLSALALPSYVTYAIRGRIPQATANLALKQVQIEQFYQDNRTYAGAPACDSDVATSEFFTFICSVQSATTYTLAATGRGSMTGFGYSITQNNTRTTTAVPSGWALPSPNSCWVTKKGGVC